MAVHTNIHWCDSSVNPTMGCDGCELWNANRKSCYAGTLHLRYGGVSKGYSPIFEELTFYPGRMKKAAAWSDLRGRVRIDKPWLVNLPRLIFVSDMSDSLSAKVPFEFLKEEVIDTVSKPPGNRHIWLWLTKRPERMAEFSEWINMEWPSNLWAGTSVTTQNTLVRANSLLKVGNEKTTRFLSVEPQIEFIDLADVLPNLDWIIQGGESGQKDAAREFDLKWAYDMVEQCKHYKVAYFLKQLGSNVVYKGEKVALKDGHGGEWFEWSKSLMVRQFPKEKLYKV